MARSCDSTCKLYVCILYNSIALLTNWNFTAIAGTVSYYFSKCLRWTKFWHYNFTAPPSLTEIPTPRPVGTTILHITPFHNVAASWASGFYSTFESFRSAALCIYFVCTCVHTHVCCNHTYIHYLTMVERLWKHALRMCGEDKRLVVFSRRVIPVFHGISFTPNDDRWILIDLRVFHVNLLKFTLSKKRKFRTRIL